MRTASTLLIPARVPIDDLTEGSMMMGLWCLDHETFDSLHDSLSIAPPYGLDDVTKELDECRVQVLYESALPILARALNGVHRLDFETVEWELLLGHWLKRLARVIINRTNTLESLLTTEGTRLLGCNFRREDLPPLDTCEAVRNFDSDVYNWAIYTAIARARAIEVVESSYTWSAPKKDPEKPRTLRTIGVTALNLISKVGTTSRSPLLITTYLPNRFMARYALARGFGFQFWEAPNPRIEKRVDQSIRSKLVARLPNSNGDKYFEIFYELAPWLIPISFLESFDTLDTLAREAKWPEHPKWIFTSNRFDTDDIFKLYVVQNKRKGAPYFVGQHGNNYGTAKSLEPSIEERTSNRFLSWGWTNNRAKVFPGFVLKLAGRRIRRISRSNTILLLQLHRANNVETWDVWAEFNQYFQRQLDFMGVLEPEISSNVKIRLHSASAKQGFGEAARWEHFGYKANLSDNKLSIFKEFAKAKLVVHSYDSTGILECLALDIPTIAFWHGGTSHLVEEAKPLYQKLFDVGIFHATPESAAGFINSTVANLESWWSSPEVVDAKSAFVEAYCRNTAEPAALLDNFLGEA